MRFLQATTWKSNFNELPRRKQRGIFKNNERPKGRGI